MEETLGKAVLKLSTKDEGLDKGIKTAQQKANDLGKNFAKVGLVVSGIGAAFAALAKKTINMGDTFNKMSQRVGVSVESLSGLKHAVELSGSSLDKLEVGLGRLSRNMLDSTQGLQSAQESFDALGISVTDSSGKLKNTDRILMEVADRFANMEDGTAKTALAMELFGRSGADLIPMLNQGSEGIRGMMGEAKSLGLVMSTDAAQASADFNDALTKLKGGLQGIMNGIVESGLLESLTNFANKAAEMIGKFATGHPTLMKIVAVVGGLAAVLGPVLIAVGAMIPAITALGGVFAAIFSPIGLIIGAIAAVTAGLALLYKKNETFHKFVDKVWGKIRDIFTKSVKWIVDKLGKIPIVGKQITEAYEDMTAESAKVEGATKDMADAMDDASDAADEASDTINNPFIPTLNDAASRLENLYNKLGDVEANVKSCTDRFNDRVALNLYHGDIISATSAILDMNGALTDNQLKLFNQSIELQAADRWAASYDPTVLALTRKMRDFTTSIEGADKAHDAMQKEFDEGIDIDTSYIDADIAKIQKGFGDTEKAGKTAMQNISSQISTTFTNMAQGLADNIIEWKGWGETLIGTVKELGKGILGAMIESFLNPFVEAVTNKITGALSGLIDQIPGISGLIGSTVSGAKSAADEAADSAGGVASGVAGAVGAGFTGWATAISTGISAAIDIAGLFGPNYQRNIQNHLNSIMHINMGIIDMLWGVGDIIWKQTRKIEDMSGMLDKHLWRHYNQFKDMIGKLGTIGKNTAALVPEGSYQSGTNYVPRTGLYRLHQGEAVVRAGGNGGGTLVANIHIGSVNGFSDFVEQVYSAMDQIRRRAGYANLRLQET